MNYYERIDRSIEFVENHLTDEISVEDVAEAAFMSVSNFYRMFLSIVGYNVKDYIRKRRLSLSVNDLYNKRKSVLETAIKYGFSSADGFSRSFKDEFGLNPSEIRTVERNSKKLIGIRRINIMNDYFELSDKKLLEAYPDIKVLKKLPEMEVACYKYFGSEPEGHAFDKMKEWINQQGFHFNERTPDGECAYRIFGFNNPDPVNSESDEVYGYEVCVTISHDIYESLEDAPCYGGKENYSKVMRKKIASGMYAVLSVKKEKNIELGESIMCAWKRFSKWMELSKFAWGGNQYLEEHLGFNDEDDHIGGVELYLPVVESKTKDKMFSPQESEIKPCRVVYYRNEGVDFEQVAVEAWNVMLAFAKKNNLDPETTCVYMYGSGFKKTPPFFHEIMMTVPDSFKFSDNLVKEKIFDGGLYMTTETTQRNQMQSWRDMESWFKETGTKYSRSQWVAQWFLTDLSFPCKKIKIFSPYMKA